MLVVESDDGLKNHIATVLSDAGYEVSTDYPEGMKAVLGFDPGVVILGADPPKLDCCDLLSEIKGSDLTRNIRVVMLSPGGPVERTRGWISERMMSFPYRSIRRNCFRGCAHNSEINVSRINFEQPKRAETLPNRL